MRPFRLSNPIPGCAGLLAAVALFSLGCDDPAPAETQDTSGEIADAAIDAAVDAAIDAAAETLAEVSPTDVPLDTPSGDQASTPDAIAETVADIVGPDVADVPEDVADVPAPSFNGEAPDIAKSLPSFIEVVDSTSTSVGPTDLLGHWTVMWFYPAATTSG